MLDKEAVREVMEDTQKYLEGILKFRYPVVSQFDEELRQNPRIDPVEAAHNVIRDGLDTYVVFDWEEKAFSKARDYLIQKISELEKQQSGQ